MGIVSSKYSAETLEYVLSKGQVWLQEPDSTNINLVALDLTSASHQPIISIRKPAKQAFVEIKAGDSPLRFVPNRTFESFFLHITLNDIVNNYEFVFLHNKSIYGENSDFAECTYYVIHSSTLESLSTTLNSPVDRIADSAISISKIYNWNTINVTDDRIHDPLDPQIPSLQWIQSSYDQNMLSFCNSSMDFNNAEAFDCKTQYICIAESSKSQNCWRPIAAFAISIEQLYVSNSSNAIPGLEKSIYFEDQAQTVQTPSPQAPEAKFIDDGPLFRATLTTLEKKIVQKKKIIKLLLAQSSSLYQQLACVSQTQKSLFNQILNESDLDRNTIFNFKQKFADLSNILNYYNEERHNLLNLKLIVPLTTLYRDHIKSAYFKRREFYEESKDFYQFLQRYLADQREDKRKDEKFQARKRQFELRRFDYMQFVNSICGDRGRYETFSRLFEFARDNCSLAIHASKLLEPIIAELDIIQDQTQEYYTQLEARRKIEDDQRRKILSTESTETITPCIPLDNLENPLASNDESAKVHKEGILLASSRPNMHVESSKPTIPLQQSWHKYWVVLSEGKLCEYFNWKTAPELHNEPILLKACTVREARKVDRRFCFEIITPSIQRVYQCQSNEDLQDWIKCIQTSISKSLLMDWHIDNIIQQNNDFTNSSPTLNQNEGPSIASAVFKDQKSLAQSLGNKLSSIISGKASNVTSGQSISSPITTTNPQQQTNNPSNSQFIPSDLAFMESMVLINLLRSLDPQNKVCADCYGSEDVEWVSINFCTILCINCAGSHRSLGTQISKVRSLMLDNVSFNQNLVRLLSVMTNSKSNSVLEAELDQKILPDASSDVRLNFIILKYKTRKYLNATIPLGFEDWTSYTLSQIEKNSIEGVYNGIMHEVDPNEDVDSGITLLQKSLDAFEVIQESSSSASVSSSISLLSLSNTVRKLFPISELLGLNQGNFKLIQKDRICDNIVLEYYQTKVDKLTNMNSALPKLEINQSNANKIEKEKRLSARIGMKLNFH